MNKKQQLGRLAMTIVNQLFDLADVPVVKRQAINDKADAFVLRLLQQHHVMRPGTPEPLALLEQELKKVSAAPVDFLGFTYKKKELRISELTNAIQLIKELQQDANDA